jgi:quercetin dioxygenase-like cupin family protein
MTVIRQSQLNLIETPGGNAGAALATASRGAQEVSVIKQRQQPGGVNPDHYHDREETLIVLAGEVEVSQGDQADRLQPGDAVIVAPGQPHRVRNTGAVEAEWLLVAPAGVKFFHANGEQASPPWSL